MPNHVSNRIEASKEVLDEILSIDDDGQVVFDFNTIIPMPDYIYQGDLGRAERAIYGENNWYDWAPKNWGTKWNAYSVIRASDDTLEFETAWSHPVPIIEALSKLYPEEEFLVAYADEDAGHNLGVYTVKNGMLLEEGHIDEGSYEAFKLANLLTGYDRIEIIREEINELEGNWDKYKDYPRAEEELQGYKQELEDYVLQSEFSKISRPEFDENILKSYLNI